MTYIQPGWPVAQTVGCHCATNASTPRHLQTTTPAMPPIRRSFSGTRLNAICWRRTLSRSPWRRRMRRRLQRWCYQKLQGITSINIADHLQVLSLVSPLRLLLLPEDWKELESHIEAREDTPIFIYNSRCSISLGQFIILFKVCDATDRKSEETEWWGNKRGRNPPRHWNYGHKHFWGDLVMMICWI